MCRSANVPKNLRLLGPAEPHGAPRRGRRCPRRPAAAAAPAEPAAVAEDAPAAPVAEAAVAPEGDKHAHEHEHEHKPTHHEHKPTHHEHKPAPTHYESEPEHYYEVSKPQVHPHPINLHAILTALKYVGPVVGDLIQPFALNIVHAIIGAITETLSSESNLEKALESIGLGLKEQNQGAASSVVKFINDDNATSERKGYGLTIELSCHDALAVSVSQCPPHTTTRSLIQNHTITNKKVE
ncbi:unnamed protein product [Bemisia tabaci]|uniref:Uncharacterized protein n=1 Tax=Bemisia tabaci TaxID=7038 RepID=A0A9P0AHT1_BEMTA|nr:unnamed protein product [Bemisia tabaci]